MTECSVCVVKQRESRSTVKPGYLWYGGQYGDWDRCDHCKGTAIEPISGYQVVINGKTRQIESLSREELIAELISAIDKLEDIDEINEQIAFKIKAWREGE